MRSTEKTSELEKQVSHLRSKHLLFKQRIEQAGTRVEDLISFRQPLRNLTNSANNATMCSMLYSGESFAKQLKKVKADFVTLAATNEKVISSRFSPKQSETASTRLKSLAAELSIARSGCADGYTAYHDGTAVVPVYYLKYSNLPDVANFIHNDYALWFKSSREFSTGFIGWPTQHNWKQVGTSRPTNRELLAALEAAIREDGLM